MLQPLTNAKPHANPPLFGGTAISPTVSVVIPTYNSAHFVSEAIESVLAQSYADFELIIVDDGSTDNTREVVARYTDPRVRYIFQPNQERSVARNTGIQAAQGQYIAFLDADDLWLPDKLDTQVHLMGQSPHLGLVYVGAYVMEAGQIFFEQVCQYRGRVVRPLLTVDNIVTGSASSALVRREALAQVGGFDPAIPVCEDWDLWLRLAQHYEFDFVARPLIKVRVHGTNTQKQAEKMKHGTLLFFEKVLNEPSLQAEVQPVRPQIESLAQFMVARSYYAARNMPQARHYYWKAIQASPTNTRAWQYLVRSLISPHRTEQLRALRNKINALLRFRGA